MIDLSKEELAKLAKFSGLQMSEQESEELIQDLRVLLSYSQQILELAVGAEAEENKSVNVFREDKVYNQSAINVNDVFEHKLNEFLVVPRILD